MPKRISPSSEKSNLHPRNRHRQRYDFPALIKKSPKLEKYVSLNPYGELSIDFKDTEAVRILNQALLRHFYNIPLWDVPPGYLCPPIPGRADYIHYVADLLAEANQGIIPIGTRVKVLDIGVGANCIYPLIGTREYGWKFIGSEVDPGAMKSAKNIVDANGLASVISIRRQTLKDHFFSGVLRPGEKVDLTVCNPPFYGSYAEADQTSRRKWTKLGMPALTQRNFGGQNTELWCEGGEQRFVLQMIKESVRFAGNCLWFTTLISSKETLPACYRALKELSAVEVKTIPMSQGQKVSRILAWTFLKPEDRNGWRSGRWT